MEIQVPWQSECCGENTQWFCFRCLNTCVSDAATLSISVSGSIFHSTQLSPQHQRQRFDFSLNSVFTSALASPFIDQRIALVKNVRLTMTVGLTADCRVWVQR
jgi:hypothetical protein